jgi:hypothetical protein
VTSSFRRFAACSALLAAAASLVFTVAFAVVVQEGERWAQWVSWTALLIGGLLSVPVLTALYARLGRSEPEFALLAVVFGVAGAFGAAVHGAFEWSVLANPPGPSGDLPSAVDPRGFLTFGVTGIALGLFGWLICRVGSLPRSAGGLGLAAAALLLVVYVGRLTVLDPKTDVIRIAALVSGLVLVPGFYFQVGRGLLRAETDATSSPATHPVAAGLRS